MAAHDAERRTQVREGEQGRVRSTSSSSTSSASGSTSRSRSSELDEELFEEGFGFDGSSIRGWQPINASRHARHARPDDGGDRSVHGATRRCQLICNIVDPITKEDVLARPAQHRAARPRRTSSRPASATSRTSDRRPSSSSSTRSATSRTSTAASTTSTRAEGAWNTGPRGGPEPRLQAAPQGRLLPGRRRPTRQQDIRAGDGARRWRRSASASRSSHHEVATAGQGEIDMRFLPLVKMGDELMWFKYIVKNVARAPRQDGDVHAEAALRRQRHAACTATSRIWKGEKPLFAGDGYAGMSEMALHYIGGILKHAPALAAFTNPTTNSYRRLVPGFEAPVNLAYSSRNRSAAIRIPMYSPSPKAKRIEVRFPDPACNRYLAFAAMLMAGLDGIERRLDPGEPLDKDIYALSPEELKDVPRMPGSLDEALDNLEEGPRVPAQGRRLHRGRDRDLDRVQDGERGRRACACARIRTSSRSTTTPDSRRSRQCSAGSPVRALPGPWLPTRFRLGRPAKCGITPRRAAPHEDRIHLRAEARRHPRHLRPHLHRVRRRLRPGRYRHAASAGRVRGRQPGVPGHRRPAARAAHRRRAPAAAYPRVLRPGVRRRRGARRLRAHGRGRLPALQAGTALRRGRHHHRLSFPAPGTSSSPSRSRMPRRRRSSACRASSSFPPRCRSCGRRSAASTGASSCPGSWRRSSSS